MTSQSAIASSASDLAVDAMDIARRFGPAWVLRGVTLRVHGGEVVGLMGANGSGKSTLLRILATLLRPHAGSARVCGHDITHAANDVRSLIGYLAHSPGLYDDLTARENLAFAARMLGREEREIDRALDRVGMLGSAARQVRGLSAGMQRRLALARLMLGTPRLLLLDEPYGNLDSDGIDLLNTLIGEWASAGVGILVVLHELAPAAGMLHRTVTIEEGRIAGAPTPSVARHVPMSIAAGRR